MAENTNFNLSFKYGEFKNLPAISNGTIYVTTDDKTMYVDLNGQRIRLGDVSVHKSLTDLTGDKASWYTGALAYIADGNHLAYFNGTKWIDINDPGVQTKIEAAIATEVINRNIKVKEEEERAKTAEGALSDKIDDIEDILDGITGTSGTLASLETNLKKYTDDAAKVLIGEDTDTTTAKTIAGAKTFATNAAGNAVTTANANTASEIGGLKISYDSGSQTVILKNKAGTAISSFSATDFIKDGMLTGVSYNKNNNTLTFTWNIAPGGGDDTTTTINLTDLVDVYTGVQNGGIIVDGLNIKIDDEVVVTHNDLTSTVSALQGYADNAVSEAIQQEITDRNGAISGGISGLEVKLIGGDTDNTTAKTIAGAKAFATNAANAAKNNANAYTDTRLTWVKF